MTPLIVGFGINGWNVYRALRQRGISPVVLDNDRASIFWKTRGCRLRYSESLAGPALLAGLADLAGSGERFLFVSGVEETVDFLNRHRSEIASNIHLPFPDPETVDALLDKKQFYAAARAAGASVPPMYFLHPGEWRPEDGGGALPFPCILKTRRKMYVPGMAKAYRLRNRAELEETLRRLSSLPGLSPEHMLIQQWVPGGDDRVIFCMQYYDRHGNRPISFVGRKIRQWPPGIGGTCSAIASPDPVAERESTSFFESVRMRGICSMEFKRSEDDNKLYMIEPTVCRADYQEGTATANGFNLPYALYCAECDLKPYTPAPRARAAVWVHVGPDFRSAMQTAGPSWRARWNWWRSLRGRKAFAVFHASAPGPFLELIRRKAVSRMRRILPLL